MNVLLLTISAVAGVLQIILFFKLWGMTNNVKEMYKIISNKVDIMELDVPNFQDYFEKEITRAERMIAIGDNNVLSVLKGLRYDTERYYKFNSGALNPEESCAVRCARIDKMLETIN